VEVGSGNGGIGDNGRDGEGDERESRRAEEDAGGAGAAFEGPEDRAEEGDDAEGDAEDRPEVQEIRCGRGLGGRDEGLIREKSEKAESKDDQHLDAEESGGDGKARDAGKHQAGPANEAQGKV